MPRQNRVTPFGAIIATPARGALMGNRGCLHDAAGCIRRPFQTIRWIICRLAFKERRRTVMTPGHYTELFFLDEATALAAGHRPCAECSRERFDLFRRLWTAANPDLARSVKPSATWVDTVLHSERIAPDGSKLCYRATLAGLPGGVFVTLDQRQAMLWFGGKLWPWRPEGYGPPVADGDTAVVDVLTPRSVVHTLAHGYPVAVHPSAAQAV
jgi:hypothetical protein